jgi:hypothetical protein
MFLRILRISLVFLLAGGLVLPARSTSSTSCGRAPENSRDVRIYPYAHADPVNLVDPSGYFASAGADVGIASASAVTMNTMGAGVAISVYLSYAIHSGAKGIYQNAQLNEIARRLQVEVEPAVYLHEVQNGLDGSQDRRKREPGWEYFAHGTSTGSWGSSSAIMASGGGDFGTGFYTFKANLRGLFAAGVRANRIAKSPMGGGLPFILVAKITKEDLGGIMTTAQDLRSDSAQWATTVSGYLNNGGQGLSGHPIVIGPVSAQGRNLQQGETPMKNMGLPNQWKWEDLSRLKPAAIIPVLAW